MIEKKFFEQALGSDCDTNLRSLPQQAYLRLMNGRIAVSKNGRGKRIENCAGTLQISQSVYPPYGQHFCIGSTTYSKNDNLRIVFALYNTSNDHGIYCYDLTTGLTYAVVYDSQVVQGLNFSKNSRINRNMKVVDDVLYFCDGDNNEPKAISIEAGIKANHPSYVTTAKPYSFPIDFTELTLIRRPSVYAPNFVKITDSTFANNFIANNSFQFAFVYTYYNNQQSVSGVYSRGTRFNKDGDTFNAISVKMDIAETVPQTVRFIDLVVRIGNGVQRGSEIAYIVKTWDKNVPSENAEIVNHNNGIPLSYNFYNNVSGTPIAKDLVLKQFDNVPLYSWALELARNRIFLANNIEGYDTPTVKPNFKVTLNQVQPSITTASHQLYFVTIIYFFGNPIDSYFYAGYYVKLVGSQYTQQGYYEMDSPYNGYATGSPAPAPTLSTPPSSYSYSSLTFRGTDLTSIVNAIKVKISAGAATSTSQAIVPSPATWFDSAAPSTINVTGYASPIYDIFKTGAEYNAGAVFYDFALRRCGVSKPDTLIVLVGTVATTVSTTSSYISFNPTGGLQPLAGDIITITGNATLNGNYTVSSSFVNNAGNLIIFITGSFSIVSGQGATITLNRPTKKISIPERNFAFSSGIGSINWQLDNANAVNEIPEKAYYYSIVRTVNLKTPFFVNGYSNNARYVTLDSDNKYQYNDVLFQPSTFGLSINIQSLFTRGLGYTYSEGDVAILSISGSNITLPIIAQDGNYAILKSQDVGDLSNFQCVFELYTPYKANDQAEPFYEIGEIYSIVNPTTNTRSYSILNDVLYPDSTVMTKSYSGISYLAEAMCPNDLYYKRWDGDVGKPNFITKLGQARKSNYGSFSNVYISGTANNGLNTFEALNQFFISDIAGQVNNLILTDKVQDKGTVMIAICTNETVSVYLGETQISDGTGESQFFAQARGVVGTINPLKGSFGTVNPESVITYLGLIFWFDALNGVFVQYSPNGLEPVSRYGITRFFQNYASEYRAASTNNLDNINGFHHCPTFFDTFHKEIGITLPALIYDNYADILPSYSSVPSYATSIINRFDVFDRLGKSMSFCYEENKWGQDYNFMGEWYEHIENRMFGWKNGVMYEFNADAANTNRFFGVQYPTRLCFVANFNPSLLKVLDAIAVEGNEAPNFTVALAAYPNLQITDLDGVTVKPDGNTDYVDEEGFFRASFYKDRLSPNSIGTPEQRLYTGDSLTDVAIQIMLEWQKYNGLLWVNAVDVNYSASRGSKSLTQPNNL